MVVLPQTRSSSFHGVENLCSLDGMKLFKHIRTYGFAVLPQTRPSSFDGVEEPFRFLVMQPTKIIQVHGWAALPNIPCHGQTHFAALKNRFALMLCRSSTTFKKTNGRAPPNTIQLISLCWRKFFVWIVWNFSTTFELKAGPCSLKHVPVLFTVLKNRFVWMLWNHLKTFKLMAGPRSPTCPVTAQLISRRWKIISFWCYADFQQRSNERMIVLPQTRSRSFHGVEEPFGLDGTKLFKNIRTYGWAVLLQTRPSSFHCFEKLFPLKLCNQVNTIKLMAGLRSRTTSVTAQLILRRWRTIAFWCCANFQQRSHERMVVLPQTQPSCFHDVANSFFLDGIRLFKNIRIYGWAVLLQTRPSFFHGVKKPFRLDVLALLKNIQIHGWAALPNIPCHGPAHFAALKNHFVLMLCRLSTTFKWTAGRVPPNTVQGISRCWRLFLSGW